MPIHLITERRAAELLGVPEAELAALREAGEPPVPFIRTGDHGIRYDAADVRRKVEEGA